ncbi:MAG: DUF4097 family beta strand repeat protein [Fidelibacterota bacterium]|nr:MAG: DUF4097 family beta strand repeat protein [Candidatus Neomarinimicrobiota bacterium]
MLKIKGVLLAGAIWVALLVLATSLSARPADDSGKITRSFNVDYGGTLTVDTERGSIEVTTTRAKNVEVEITRKVSFGWAGDADEILEDFEIEFDHSGKDVSIVAESRRGWGWFGRNIRLRIHYAITVPEKYNLDLATSGGSIKIADLEGDVKCETSGGSLNISQIKGSIYGRTSGGSITLKGSDGEADLKTSGGGINIGQVAGHVEAHTSGGSIYIDEAGGEVEVSTSGGSIHVSEVQGTIRASTSGGSIRATISKQPKSDCSLKTSGGGVTVHLAEGIKVDVDAKTSGGNVRCEMPIMVQGLLGKNEVKGKVNGGGPELYLRSSGGPVRILNK